MDWYCVVDNQSNGPHSQDKIESLLRFGKIDRNTLVWRQGMDDWTPLESVEDLKNLLEPTPPPITDVPELDADLEPAPDGDDKPGTAVPQISSTSSSIATESDLGLDHEVYRDSGSVLDPDPIHAQGGPWSRYFARMLDLSITSLVVVFVIEYSLPHLWEGGYAIYRNMNDFVLGLILLPVVMLQNALVLTMFGNSLGKTLFGLRAVPFSGAERFGLLGNIEREFRVWFSGLAIGIPLITLFTMLLNYQEVKHGRPAKYDRGFANIEVMPISAARRSIAMIGAVIFVVSIAALSNWAERIVDENEQQTAQSEQQRTQSNQQSGKEEPAGASGNSWKNPVTGKSAVIPAGWTYEARKTTKGNRYYAFKAPDSSKTVYIAADKNVSDSIDLRQYTKIFDKHNSRGIKFAGSWHHITFNSKPMMQRDGLRLKDNVQITYLLEKSGTTFWRIIIYKHAQTDRSDPVKWLIVESLVQTIALPKNLQVNQNEQKTADQKIAIASGIAWRNPVTGLSATIPVGWTHRASKSKEQVKFDTFSAPDKSKIVYIAVDESAPGAMTLLEYAEQYEETMSNTVTFTGNWQNVTLFGRSMLRTSGKYRKNDAQLTYFLEKVGFTFWLIISIERRQSESSDYDTMPVVESLVRTFS